MDSQQLDDNIFYDFVTTSSKISVLKDFIIKEIFLCIEIDLSVVLGWF